MSTSLIHACWDLPTSWFVSRVTNAAKAARRSLVGSGWLKRIRARTAATSSGLALPLSLLSSSEERGRGLRPLVRAPVREGSSVGADPPPPPAGRTTPPSGRAGGCVVPASTCAAQPAPLRP